MDFPLRPGKCGFRAAKVALLYKTTTGDWKVMGWTVVEPDPKKTVTIPLPDLADNELYACVVFDDPGIIQFADEDSLKKKAAVVDGAFSYFVGKETLGAAAKEKEFFKLDPAEKGLYRSEDGNFWLNLSDAGG